jgi:hypothetical protein
MTKREAWLKAAQEICEKDGRTRMDEAKRGKRCLAKLDADIEALASDLYAAVMPTARV